MEQFIKINKQMHNQHLKIIEESLEQLKELFIDDSYETKCNIKSLVEKINKMTKQVNKLCNDKKKKIQYDTHTFVLIKNKSKYHIMNRQNASVKSAIKQYCRRHQQSRILLQIPNNEKNLWSRIKNYLSDEIKSNRNDFTLKKKYNQESLIKHISELKDNIIIT